MLLSPKHVFSTLLPPALADVVTLAAVEKDVTCSVLALLFLVPVTDREEVRASPKRI